MRQRTKVSQLPLDQCGRGTSVGGESAAGGRLEAGGRELVMRTENDGTSSCKPVNKNGHLDVERASGCGESAAGGRGARAGDADSTMERSASLSLVGQTMGRSASCWRPRARTPACLRTSRSSSVAESLTTSLTSPPKKRTFTRFSLSLSVSRSRSLARSRARALSLSLSRSLSIWCAHARAGRSLYH
jgi:hypothetical protein